MKIIFCLAVTILLSCSKVQAVEPEPEGLPISREEAQSLVAYDLEKLENKSSLLAGKIVRLKFNYREEETKEMPDGRLRGTLRIWKSSTGAAGSRYKWGDLTVYVPAAGRDWFMKIFTRESRATLNVIARLSADGKEPAELLGREIKTDSKGSRIVW